MKLFHFISFSSREATDKNFSHPFLIIFCEFLMGLVPFAHQLTKISFRRKNGREKGQKGREEKGITIRAIMAMNFSQQYHVHTYTAI